MSIVPQNLAQCTFDFDVLNNLPIESPALSVQLQVSPQKRCTKCGEMKSVECFGKSPGCRDGLRGQCKDCVCVYSREYYKQGGKKYQELIELSPEELEFRKTHKRCTKCGETKGLDHFGRRSNKRSELGFIYLSQCKECVHEDYLERRSRLKEVPVEDLPTHKTCTKCHMLLPRSSFSPSNKSNDRLNSWCKTCNNDNARIRRSTDHRRDQCLRYDYGITLEEYNRMLDAQGGVCFVCKLPETHITGRPLSVDHCHETGMVRGLLCSTCNTALGMVQEDPDRLRALLEYAEYCQSLKSSAS